MRWNISDENQLTVILQNDLSLLNCAPDASVTRRGLYPLILKVYNRGFQPMILVSFVTL